MSEVFISMPMRDGLHAGAGQSSLQVRQIEGLGLGATLG